MLCVSKIIIQSWSKGSYRPRKHHRLLQSLLVPLHNLMGGPYIKHAEIKLVPN